MCDFDPAAIMAVQPPKKSAITAMTLSAIHSPVLLRVGRADAWPVH
jgi:hypothetical protein